MANRRVYCPSLRDGTFELDAEQANHARRVLRLDMGDTLEVFDGAGQVGTARVVEAGKRMTIQIIERHEAPRPRPWIDLAVAIPKGGRADVMVEKASELGADRLIPLLTDRSVVEPRGGKLERFERLALESAKQCGRNWVMQVDEPAPLDDLIAQADHDLKLIADVAADGPRAVQNVHSEAKGAKRVIVLIGPEGGWTDRERNAAFSAGFLEWRLAPNVLRIETAATAALAILRHEA